LLEKYTFFNFNVNISHEYLEEAFDGYILFCHFFLQNECKDENIILTIRENNSLEYLWKEFEFPPSYDGKTNILFRDIMKFIKNFSDNDYFMPKDPEDFWVKLEEETSRKLNDSSTINTDEQSFVESILKYKEKDLLSLYYTKQLEKTYGNVKAASKLVGMPENTFRSRLDKYKVEFRKQT
jgi:hypothetical protein